MNLQKANLLRHQALLNLSEVALSLAAAQIQMWIQVPVFMNDKEKPKLPKRKKQ